MMGSGWGRQAVEGVLQHSLCRIQKGGSARAPVVDVVAAHHGGCEAAHRHAGGIAAVDAGRRIRLPLHNRAVIKLSSPCGTHLTHGQLL
jgi:hypothetical protein